MLVKVRPVRACSNNDSSIGIRTASIAQLGELIDRILSLENGYQVSTDVADRIFQRFSEVIGSSRTQKGLQQNRKLLERIVLALQAFESDDSWLDEQAKSMLATLSRMGIG